MSNKNDQARAGFLADHHAQIVACFDEAIRNELVAPVILLIDPEDPIGEDILEEFQDCLPPGDASTLEAESLEAEEDLRGVVFVIEYEDAIRRLHRICDNCVRFLEQTQSVKSQIDKAGRLMMYMVVSFGMIDCKLEPRPANH